ncbi:MAG TPA: hypothetical protein PLH11_06910 [Gemmobacter sp.]|nr:hypothetical protein [Gemmobacter sp.]
MIPDKRRMASAAVAFLCCSAPCAAFDLTSFFGPATCAQDDAPCQEAAFEQGVKDWAAETHDHAHLGRTLAVLMQKWPAKERSKMAARLDALSLPSEALENWKQRVAQIEAEQHFTYAGFLKAYDDAVWPDAFTWREYSQQAIPVILADPAQAPKLWELWLSDRAFFEEHAPREGVKILDWGLSERPDEVMAWLKADTSHMTATLSAPGLLEQHVIAACDAGNKADADRILAEISRQQATQIFEGLYAFLPLASEYDTTVACGTKDEAMAAFERLSAAVENSATYAKNTFERGLPYQALRTSATYHAVRLENAGDHKAALNVLMLGTGRMVSLGEVIEGEDVRTVTLHDVLVKGEFPDAKPNAEQRLEEELQGSVNLVIEEQLLKASAAETLIWFTNQYDPAQHGWNKLGAMVEAIEKAPKDAHKLHALTKAVALLDQPGSELPAEAADGAVFRLRLAAVEKALGCKLSEATWSKWLKTFASAESYQTRIAGYAAVIGWSHVAPTKDTAQHICLFE